MHRHHRHNLRRGRFKTIATLDGVTCTTSTPNGARTSDRQVKQARPRPGRAQIQHRDQLAADSGPGRRTDRAHARPRRRRLADQLQLRRQIVNSAECAARARRSVRRRQSSTGAPPARSRRTSGRVPEAAAAIRRASSAPRPPRRVRAARAAASAGGLAAPRRRPRSRPPPMASEMIAASLRTRRRPRASFSSVSPSAARWRCPSSRLTRGFTERGRKHAAAAIRSPWTITAPSCSGDAGWKMLAMRS